MKVAHLISELNGRNREIPWKKDRRIPDSNQYSRIAMQISSLESQMAMGQNLLLPYLGE